MFVYTLDQRWEILQYFMRVLGEGKHRKLRLYISKNFAFGAQSPRSHTLKCRCTHNKSLFGADFNLDENEQEVAATLSAYV